MKIIRNRQEFELTPEEMRQAYEEKKNEYTIEDIRSLYDMPDNKINETLMMFERTIGGNDNFWDSYWSMIEYIAEKMELKEKEG